MKPPANLVQGKPSYKLNSGKYKPHLGEVTQPTVGTDLASNILPNRKVKNEYIPTPLKQMGILDEISLACRSVNDLRRVVRGNGVFFNKQLVNATPISGLSRQAFSNDRVGEFGFNPKQDAQVTVRTF
jgi:hypothetical protein